MISGKETVSNAARLLRSAVLAGVAGIVVSAPNSTRLAVTAPAGLERFEYARGLEQITGIEILADGTLLVTRQDPRDRYEISPAQDGEPLSIRRVAVELAVRDNAGSQAVFDTRARGLVRFEWHPDSGELTWAQAESAQLPEGDVPLSAVTLQLARGLAHRPFMDMALAPDGTLFVADTSAGVIYRVGHAR